MEKYTELLMTVAREIEKNFGNAVSQHYLIEGKKKYDEHTIFFIMPESEVDGIYMPNLNTVLVNFGPGDQPSRWRILSQSEINPDKIWKSGELVIKLMQV